MKHLIISFLAIALPFYTLEAHELLKVSNDSTKGSLEDTIFLVNRISDNTNFYFSYTDKFDDSNSFRKINKVLPIITPYTCLELSRFGNSKPVWLRTGAEYDIVGEDNRSPIFNTSDSILNKELNISDSLDLDISPFKTAKQWGNEYRSGVFRSRSEENYNRKLSYLEKQKSGISQSFYLICKKHFLVQYMNRLLFLYIKDPKEDIKQLLQYKDSFQLDDLSFSSDYREFCLTYNRFLLLQKMDVSQITLLEKYLSAKANFKGKTLDYMLFNYVRSSIQQEKSTKLADLFMKDSQDNDYKQYIKSLINVRNASVTNKDILFTPDMKTVLFKDLISKYKDKIVYIDFWASWCFPCRELMSQSHIWKEKYKRDVVFLYVSTDEISQEWLSASTAEHLAAESSYLISANSDFVKNEKIKQIPRFMIFDREGKLVDDNAMRVDDKDFEQKMNKIIFNKK